MVSRWPVIVFDWDGTLVNSIARIVDAAKAAIEDLDMPPREDAVLRDVIGLGLSDCWQRLFPESSEERFRAFVARYRHRFLHEEAVHVELFVGARETLESLAARGYRLAVATGKSRFGLDRELEVTGVTRLFEITRCADETRSKPDPQMLIEIMTRLDATPDETLMVGDTEYDLAMAHAAGTDAVAVSGGAHEKPRLLRWQPLTCLNQISELTSWLSEISDDADADFTQGTGDPY